MKHKQIHWLVVLLLVALVYFYKSILLGLLPFPGDVLVSEYKPWQSYSYLGYIPGSIPNKAQYFDVIRQLYPWRVLGMSQLGEGRLPLWNPYNFSGAPLLANHQSAILYPLNVLFGFLDAPIAWSLLVILQPIFASMFTFLYARRVGIGPLGSIFAAVSFSYSLFMTTFLEYNIIGHTIMWLPLALFAIEMIIEKISPIAIVLLCASLVFSSLAGSLQSFVLIIAFCTVYALLRCRHGRIVSSCSPGALSVIVLVTALSLGIAAIQLIPTVELLSLSARTPHDLATMFQNLLFQPFELTRILSPDIFGNPATRNYLLRDSYPSKAASVGVLPFALAVFAIVKLRKTNPFVGLFSLTLGVLWLFLIRSPITEIFYSLRIPLVSTSAPTNALFISSFALSILCGFGIELVYKGNISTFLRVLGILAGAFIISIGAYRIFGIPIMPRGALVTLLILGAIGAVLGLHRLKVATRVLTYLLFLLTVGELWYFFIKFNPFVPPSLVFPDAPVMRWLQKNAGIDRFWGYGTAAIEANIPTYYRLFSPDGYDPLYPRIYGEFIQASKKGKLTSQFSTTTRSDATIASGYGVYDLMSNPYRLRILNLLGVRYILDRTENGSTQETFPPDQFRLSYEDNGWRVYENLKSLPRVFASPSVNRFQNQNEFEASFFDPSIDPGHVLLVDADISSFDPEARATVVIRSYTPTRIDLASTTQGPQYLFLSDTYYPGWQAFIDGQPSPVLRAHYAFRAVYIPAGRHDISFQYRPRSLTVGLEISVVSSLVLLVFLVVVKKRRVL